jgi:hypothetical protein
MELAWHIASQIEADLEDLEGALASGDLGTAFEAALFATNATAVAWECIENDLPIPTTEPEYYATLGYAQSHALATYAKWPSVTELTEARMLEIATNVRAAVERLREALPFQLPNVRQHDGLMPALRAARGIDRFRSQHGVRPFSWPGIMS